ncbi:MAG: GAF domain-containing protein [Aliishimia sp.]
MNQTNDVDATQPPKAQNFAKLVIVSKDWRVIGVSQGAQGVLGFDPAGQLDDVFEAVFTLQTAHRLRSRSQVLSPDDPIIHIPDCPYPNAAGVLNVTAVLCADHYVFAFEPHDTRDMTTANVEQVQRLVNRVARKTTLAEAANEATRALSALTLMDRVSLHPVRAGRVWPALGHASAGVLSNNVPAQITSAIAAQDVACVQYLSDINGGADPILSKIDLSQALDMAILPCRTSSEAQRAALAANGVRSAYQVPILLEGGVWGVFLCHHSAVGLPNFAQRSFLNLFATLVGHTLGSIAAREGGELQSRATHLRDDFLGAVDASLSFETASAQAKSDIQEINRRIDTSVLMRDDTADIEKSWLGLQQLVRHQLTQLAPNTDAQLEFSQGDLAFSAQAFTALAVVLHELTQNAVTHGALRGDIGRVRVSVAKTAIGQGVLYWREENVGKVAKPACSGGGLMVIEQAVPFILDGASDVDFDEAGLCVRLRIPARHMQSTALPAEVRTQQSHIDPSREDRPLDGKTALVLDDSLLMALDAGDLLTTLGATHVHTCNSVNMALQSLAAGDVDFALLDVDLGHGTSQQVAMYVRHNAIPAALATGYDVDSDALQGFPEMPILMKPFSVRELAVVVRQAMDLT